MAISTINYTNKEALNENPSVAVKNKISADDMNEIKSVVNNNANEMSNIINREQYSTNEIQTNKTWIDGKSIYRKVYTGITANGDTYINMSSLHISQIVNIEGIVGQNDDFKPINFAYDNYKMSTRYGSGVMYVNAPSVYANLPFYLIVEYTKTTD